MLKALAAMALLVSTPSVPQTVTPAPKIPRVVCFVTPTSLAMGTAFRIGPHLLLSVRHVTDEENCYIDGEAIKVTYKAPGQDFSILSDDRAGPFLKVDCGGFVKGRKYIAIGHARGLEQLTTVELTGTGTKSGQFSILSGIFTYVPGQSGGPTIDVETGAVVGTNNVYDMERGLSGSVALKDTPICGAKP